MFVGLSLAKASASSFADQRLVDEFLGLSGGSMWVSFLGAILLTFIVQSSSAVIVLGISMGAVGLLTFDQVFMTVYGSYIGSSAILLVLSWAPDRSGAPGRDVPDSLQPRDGCNLCSAVSPGAMVRSTADESTTPGHSLGTTYSGAGYAERFTRPFCPSCSFCPLWRASIRDCGRQRKQK